MIGALALASVLMGGVPAEATPRLPLSLEREAPVAEPLELVWSRRGPGEAIRVQALHPGPSLAEAEAALQRVGDLLDVLRTTRPHMVWTRLQWRSGHIKVDGRAESSLYAGLAMRLLRKLHPGYRTAGSGIQQLHNVPEGGWAWRLRALLAPPRSKSPQE
jgi:hypothetical protein